MGEDGRAQGSGTDDGPLDLAAVQADDRLIDAVHTGDLPGETAAVSSVDETVIGLLVAWRDEIEAAPLPAHPDLDEAAAVLRVRAAASSPWHRRVRLAAPITAAAAAVAVVLSGVGYAAHESVPGDPLWGLSQTVFADHSRSVQAAADVESALARAELALGAGSPAEAQVALESAATAMTGVRAPEGRDELERRRQQAEQRLAGLAPGTPAPSATSAAVTTPAPVDPPSSSSARPSPEPSSRPLSSATTPIPSTTTTTTGPTPTTSPPETTTPSPTTDATSAATTTPTADPTVTTGPSSPPTTTSEPTTDASVRSGAASSVGG